MRSLAAILFLAVSLSAEAQIIKTSLNITVRDELGNTAEGVTVKLFENEADYLAEKNPSIEGVTDAKGFVRFKNLKAIAYYILAKKDDKDNAGKGEKTSVLEEKKINKVTIIIE